MKKATHVGACQWCGSRQMLPGGVLALHGYTTKWGYFHGTCRGAGRQPYEVACELVGESVMWAEAERRNLQAWIDVLLTPATTPAAWVDEYVSMGQPTGYQRRAKSSGHEWRHVGLGLGERFPGSGYLRPGYVALSDEFVIVCEYDQELYSLEGAALVLKAATLCNARRACDVAKQRDQVEAYIGQQIERVEKWAPATLQERAS